MGDHENSSGNGMDWSTIKTPIKSERNNYGNSIMTICLHCGSYVVENQATSDAKNCNSSVHMCEVTKDSIKNHIECLTIITNAGIEMLSEANTKVAGEISSSTPYPFVSEHLPSPNLSPIPKTNSTVLSNTTYTVSNSLENLLLRMRQLQNQIAALEEKYP